MNENNSLQYSLKLQRIMVKFEIGSQPHTRIILIAMQSKRNYCLRDIGLESLLTNR